MKTIVQSILLTTGILAAMSAAAGRDPVSHSDPMSAPAIAQSPGIHSIFVLGDISGSFNALAAQSGLSDRSRQFIRKMIIENAEIGTQVRHSVIGHEHTSVSGNNKHLAAFSVTVSRNRFTPEKAATTVLGKMHNLEREVLNKKVASHNSTAILISLDHIANLHRLNGGRCMIFLLSDMDETEASTLNPATPKILQGCKVYALGAGVSLPGGSQAQRNLKTKWDVYFKKAGVIPEDFYWIPNP